MGAYFQPRRGRDLLVVDQLEHAFHLLHAGQGLGGIGLLQGLLPRFHVAEAYRGHNAKEGLDPRVYPRIFIHFTHG